MLLAGGEVATANHCQNSDLFTATRGGGPGYGSTLSTTVKAYLNVHNVVSPDLHITPMAIVGIHPDFLDSAGIVVQSFPDLNDASFAGYGSWCQNIGNSSSDYQHVLCMIRVSQRQQQRGSP